MSTEIAHPVLESNKLFTPLSIGPHNLSHRIAMAPLTRFRATKDHVPTATMAQYYAQRSIVPGTLLISEGTFISPAAGGYPYIPGLWTDAQLAGWKTVTDAVHAKGGKIFAQLWALGRAACPHPVQGGGAYADPEFDYQKNLVSASATKLWDEQPFTPRALSEEEIRTFVADYATAAKNAVEKAGFDGVEIHGAHGYLIDQFLRSVINRRTDAWGGSVEGRARFAIEVAKAVVDAVGADRVGIRLSPFNAWQVTSEALDDAEIVAQFGYVVGELRKLDLAFLHVVEPRVHGVVDVDAQNQTLDFALQAWGTEKPVLIAGGFTPELAREAVEQKYKDYNAVVVFGRRFISTPDLVYRLKKGIKWADYDRTTFYIHQEKGDKPEVGYVDYPFSKEYIEEFGKPEVAV